MWWPGAEQIAESDMQGHNSIQADLIKWIKSPSEHDHEIVTEEFTIYGEAGQPDYGTLTIRLTIAEGGKAPELKSIKHYLHQYRHALMSYERAAETIKRHLWEILDPIEVRVKIKFNVRGGLKSTLIAWKYSDG
jgi:7-cyano-7-deazaguanine reductase